jgi:ectoine hydroxylase-related dioxygenase (phytanoyl-CoA dioxygenase family)
MALNRHPLREISDEDIAVYERDGAVCLRRVLDRDWIELLEPIARRVIIDKADVGLLPTIPGRYMARRIPEYRRFVFESPIAEAAGRVMRSKEIRFFFDEFFAKPPQSDAKTLWHCDRMGWPVTGTMVPSIWIPLTPIVKANCLEVLAGTQHDDVPYWLFSPNARKMIKPDDRASHPDVESRRGEPGLRFLTWDMDPGDILIVHPWVLHYSAGNPTDDWRIAISERVFGDDIRWAPRPDCVNLAGVSFDEMIEGERPDGALFPLLWSEDGRADDDGAYPRGFSTRWEKRDMGTINDYAKFKEMQQKADAGELSRRERAPAH